MTTDHDQMSTTTVTLAVSGMTCAACAARITKRLNNSTARGERQLRHRTSDSDNDKGAAPLE